MEGRSSTGPPPPPPPVQVETVTKKDNTVIYGFCNMGPAQCYIEGKPDLSEGWKKHPRKHGRGCHDQRPKKNKRKWQRNVLLGCWCWFDRCQLKEGAFMVERPNGSGRAGDNLEHDEQPAETEGCGTVRRCIP